MHKNEVVEAARVHYECNYLSPGQVSVIASPVW